MTLDEALWKQFTDLFAGDDAALQEIVGVFLEESAQLGRRIAQGIERGDADMVRRAAHSLKSSSLQLAGRGLSETCRSMELAGASHEGEEARRLLPALDAQLLTLQAALRQRLGL